MKHQRSIVVIIFMRDTWETRYWTKNCIVNFKVYSVYKYQNQITKNARTHSFWKFLIYWTLHPFWVSTYSQRAKISNLRKSKKHGFQSANLLNKLFNNSDTFSTAPTQFQKILKALTAAKSFGFVFLQSFLLMQNYYQAPVF